MAGETATEKAEARLQTKESIYFDGDCKKKEGFRSNGAIGSILKIRRNAVTWEPSVGCACSRDAHWRALHRLLSYGLQKKKNIWTLGDSRKKNEFHRDKFISILKDISLKNGMIRNIKIITSFYIMII